MRYQGGKLGITARKCGFGLAILALLVFARQEGWSQEISPSVTVTVNKSLVFRLAQRAKRVSVTQPEVADVLVLSPNQILINGKAVGTTSLVVFDDKGQVTNYDLVVVPDVAALRRQLSAIFPEEKVEISTSGSAIVLKGEVSNETVYDKVLAIVQTYLPPKPPAEVAPPTTNITVRSTEARLPTTGTAFAGGGQLAFPEEGSLSEVNRWGDKRAIPGIIDLLTIKDVRQVQLNVVVAEVSLNKLRELGVDFLFDLLHADNRSVAFSSAGSQAGFSAGELLSDPSTFPPTTTFGDGASAVVSLLTDRYNISTVYRLFQNKDIAEILAQPRLVIKNGRSGGFLAGGEFPLAVRQFGGDESTINVEFKPFGVRLDFVPTITWSNSIDLRVFPEVSEIDRSVEVLGIPGLRVRRSVSRVEMNEGETLVMGGLLDRRITKELTKFPILGDIPILGALFRSTSFRNQESELVFLITPHIVKPFGPGEKPPLPSIEKYDDSDMRQIPLPESESSRGSTGGGPTIP